MKSGNRIDKIIKEWRSVKASTGFRKLITFLIFVVIAALFWFILALNDNIQQDFEVRINIYNVPDSVTFIETPPKEILVTVRDKGTSLWRNGVFGQPKADINFRDHSGDGVFRMNRSELTGALKNVFGQGATLISASTDSLRLTYTTLPGKRVPVVAVTELSAVSGKVISGKPTLNPQNVLVYGNRELLDTITRVYTQKVVKKNLEESVEVAVSLQQGRGMRVEPASVKLDIDVQPLVRKEAVVNIHIENVPEGFDLLLFPANVKVEYYIPMNHFNRENTQLEVSVDYRDLEHGGKKLPLHLGRHDRDMMNVEILTDSVEYTLVRN